ncbi:hypothetical protein EVAR_46412_1 [Eumeta japonica]|uniref:Uncharacterized protein n=1 Tax=Eumeta variegata TaxID=151549 RepID=A0A4C1XCC9_EUMVA|nr:hypothetical protein EVAR_46412_1 [Eumeta japonica]
MRGWIGEWPYQMGELIDMQQVCRLMVGRVVRCVDGWPRGYNINILFLLGTPTFVEQGSIVITRSPYFLAQQMLAEQVIHRSDFFSGPICYDGAVNNSGRHFVPPIAAVPEIVFILTLPTTATQGTLTALTVAPKCGPGSLLAVHCCSLKCARR